MNFKFAPAFSLVVKLYDFYFDFLIKILLLLIKLDYQSKEQRFIHLHLLIFYHTPAPVFVLHPFPSLVV